MPLAQWQALIYLNLTSSFICNKAIGGAMVWRGRGGRIINIASINAFVAGRGIGGRHYETAKAGSSSSRAPPPPIGRRMA